MGTEREPNAAFEWSDPELRRAHQRVVDRLALWEEHILKALEYVAETMDSRLGRIENSRAMLVDRLHGVEERLLQVEKRLNLPPSA